MWVHIFFLIEKNSITPWLPSPKSPVPMQIDLLFLRIVKDTSQKLIFIKLIID